jgi:hypothetical protein
MKFWIFLADPGFITGVTVNLTPFCVVKPPEYLSTFPETVHEGVPPVIPKIIEHLAVELKETSGGKVKVK